MRITTFKSITETYKKTHKKLRAFTIWPNNKNRDNHIDRNICWHESKMILSSNERRSRFAFISLNVGVGHLTESK